MDEELTNLRIERICSLLLPSINHWPYRTNTFTDVTLSEVSFSALLINYHTSSKIILPLSFLTDGQLIRAHKWSSLYILPYFRMSSASVDPLANPIIIIRIWASRISINNRFDVSREIKINGGRLSSLLKALNLCKLKCPESERLVPWSLLSHMAYSRPKSADTRLKGREMLRDTPGRDLDVIPSDSVDRESLDRHRRCSAKDVLPVPQYYNEIQQCIIEGREERIFALVVLVVRHHIVLTGHYAIRMWRISARRWKNLFFNVRRMKMTTESDYDDEEEDEEASYIKRDASSVTLQD